MRGRTFEVELDVLASPVGTVSRAVEAYVDEVVQPLVALLVREELDGPVEVVDLHCRHTC